MVDNYEPTVRDERSQLTPGGSKSVPVDDRFSVVRTRVNVRSKKSNPHPHPHPNPNLHPHPNPSPSPNPSPNPSPDPNQVRSNKFAALEKPLRGITCCVLGRTSPVRKLALHLYYSR